MHLQASNGGVVCAAVYQLRKRHLAHSLAWQLHPLGPRRVHSVSPVPRGSSSSEGHACSAEGLHLRCFEGHACSFERKGQGNMLYLSMEAAELKQTNAHLKAYLPLCQWALTCQWCTRPCFPNPPAHAQAGVALIMLIIFTTIMLGQP
eukprot:688265-Pelagomonas_calceolata.AAC.1